MTGRLVPPRAISAASSTWNPSPIDPLRLSNVVIGGSTRIVPCRHHRGLVGAAELARDVDGQDGIGVRIRLERPVSSLKLANRWLRCRGETVYVPRPSGRSSQRSA